MSKAAHAAAFVAAIAALPFVAAGFEPAGGSEKVFRISSESMAPTLATGDRIVARMIRPDSFTRGDIVLVEAPSGGTYVLRVAGLPGDRIELVDGVVILNGVAVVRGFLGTDRVTWNRPSPDVWRFAEQFPGEPAPHQIYDSGPSVGDSFAGQLVAPGRLFLLGDNRDHSADSRFPARDYGVEQVPFERVRGVLWFPYSPIPPGSS